MKRISALVLTLTMLLGMCACSSQPAQQETPVTSGASDTSEISEAAQNFPSEPITIYMQGAGSGSDIAGRIVGKYLAEELGTTALYENLGGAGGLNELNPVYDGEADGLKIALVAPAFLCITPITTSACRYTYEDFESLGCLYENPCVIAVAKDAPYDTFEEWQAYVEENPGQFRFAVPGIATIHNLALAHLKLESELEYDCIVYDGAADMIAALLGGHVEGLALSYLEVSSYLESGDLKVIAFTTQGKEPGCEEIPTLKELGYEAMALSFQGLAIKTGTDPDIVAKLKTAVEAVLVNEDFIAEMKAANAWYEGTATDGAGLDEKFSAGYDYYLEVLTETGLLESVKS